MAGPIPYPESPNQRPLGPMPHPGYPPSPYPGTLPPPVNYPPPQRRNRFALIIVALVVIALVVAVITTIVMTSRKDDGGLATVTDASATTAIQGYLDALTKGDDETVARNNSCGFFDAVTDKRSDMTLAKLTSDAFQRQYDSVEVSKIDKVVAWSPNQSQVLFTMRATPAGRSQGEVERQGIAQLLIQGPDILVCSYLPRNAGQF
ncbi:hypothetical protein TUM20985_22030 [Mycobacterium antarcticum]|uniref:Rv0361 family membrane protein n=1 Tax=Mycolicibacterium sp. TUM20985 TaxID=3023370 RepID=UPI002573B7D2|nr:hypothetical protein [Mycolicibacterium sp. TUM20985]BDX31656.1 hypothetical protein TUM20985_22030 [Mycolicibacterium sp. TUM20985]